MLRLCPPDRVDSINEIVSSVTQIIGGLIILFTINSNLGLFKQNNLIALLFCWLKSFPLFRKIKPITGSVNGTMPVITGSGEGYTSRVCRTLEEKIEEALRQIDELKEIIYRKERELLAKIGTSETNLKKLIDKNQHNLNKLNNLVSKSAVGGINTQIFGVLLVLYGAIFPLL